MEYYVFESQNEKKILQSLGLVSEYTGLPYRTILRKFKKNKLYCDPRGLFKVEKTEFIQDGRKRNSNPNMK
jgi:hypothetical protein